MRNAVLGLLVSTSALAACTPPALAPDCQSSSNCGSRGQVQTCCTATTCEYRVDDGTVFSCGGTDCAGAHLAVAAYCDPFCPDAYVDPDAWQDLDASVDASFDASLDAPALDAQPCVR